MIRVDYNGLIADVRDEDLEAGIASLRQEAPDNRRQIIKSIESALENISSQLKKGKPLTQKQLQDTANDIGIWFANEVLESRAEQYKKAVQ